MFVFPVLLVHPGYSYLNNVASGHITSLQPPARVALMGPYNMYNSVTSHYASVTDMIDLANQNHTGELNLPLRQAAANENELTHDRT